MKRVSATMLIFALSLFVDGNAQAAIVFQDNFDNVAGNTVAYPTTSPPAVAGDFDPIATVGTWVISETHDEWAQVSSFTGGVQPDSAHSGSNYYIGGHNQDVPDPDVSGLGRANLTQAVSQARAEFWMWHEPWTQGNQYGVVQGRLGGSRAWELTFENDERVKWNSNGGGGGITLPAALLMVENAWNHVVVDFDGVALSGTITINGVASTHPTLGGTDPNTFDNLYFRSEHHAFIDDLLVQTLPIPEPATATLVVLGLSSLGLLRRQRN